MSTQVMKLCTHCKFQRRRWLLKEMFPKCLHSLSVKGSDLQLVDGRAPRRIDCDEMRRKDDGPCGPEAKLWELR